MLSRSEIAAAWEGVLAQDRRSLAGDVIGFRDLFAGQLEAVSARPVLSALPVRRRSSGKALRTIHLLDPFEHATYRALLSRLAPSIERTLTNAVAADRVWSADGPLRLQPWRSARRRYRSLVGRLFAHRPGAILVADVRECFGRIRSHVVAEALARAGCLREDVGMLESLLDRMESAGVTGLPVGPEPSPVLANAVLSTADRAIAGEGGRHVRWVDDFLVAAQGERHALGILETLRASLAGLGLDLAEEKCRVVTEEAMREVVWPSPSAWAETSSVRVRGPVDPDRVFGRFEAVSSGARAVGDLAAIRSVSGRHWGGSEGDLLLRVATDPIRPPPVRAWAWRALARTDPRACLEAAEHASEREGRMGRDVVAAAGAVDGRRARAFLQKLCRRGDLRATASWALAVGPEIAGG
jgi:Reverse transcriptase (RNA-dependent DNA polymerase)